MSSLTPSVTTTTTTTSVTRTGSSFNFEPTTQNPIEVPKGINPLSYIKVKGVLLPFGYFKNYSYSQLSSYRKACNFDHYYNGSFVSGEDRETLVRSFREKRRRRKNSKINQFSVYMKETIIETGIEYPVLKGR